MSTSALSIGPKQMAQSELAVYHSGTKIAYLMDNGSVGWSLAYQANTTSELKRVSVRFPIRERPYDGDDVAGFFRNLLPDLELHRAVFEQVGLSAGNEFALVGELCAETYGALRIHRADSQHIEHGELREITHEELRNILAALTLNPLLTKVEGYRTCLPGGGGKLPLHLREDRIFLPLGCELSTHIVKSASKTRREGLQNESFCMVLADALRLPVANIELRHGPMTYLLVERFDRRQVGHRIEPIHAEDFCQLALLPPENAFQREGGLSAPECVTLLRRFSVQPAQDIKIFLRWLIFNFLIGNGQATGKQLSLLHSEHGPRLSPFYGLSSTHVYEHLNTKMAMSLGREDRPDWLIPDRWREFATQSGIKPKYVIELLEAMSVEITEQVKDVEDAWRAENGYAVITTTIRRIIERRARQLVVSLQAEAL